MALASQELGRVVGIASPDDLFTCRLLAQVVKLALAKAHPVDYAAILADCGIAKALAEPVYYPLLIELQIHSHRGIGQTFVIPPGGRVGVFLS